MSVPVDVNLHKLRKGIDHARPHSVEAAWYFIGTAGLTELTPRVEFRKNDERRGYTGGMIRHWDPASIVFHDDGVVFKNGDRNFFPISSQGFIDGIIDNFPYQMV